MIFNEHELPIKLSGKRKGEFYGNLANLCNASVDILSSFELLLAEEKNKGISKGIEKIIDELKSGMPLSEATGKGIQLTTFETAIIEAGENSGMYGPVLAELSGYFKRRSENRSVFLASLSYPLIVLLTSTGILWFMLTYMVPMFTESYKRLNTELPLITQLVISASKLVSSSFPYILILILLITLGIISVLKNPELKKQASDFMFSISILRRILEEIELNRFFIMMRTLSIAKVQLTDALRHSSKACFTPTFSGILLDIESSILNGSTFNNALSSKNVFPLRVQALIRLGEETNTLALCFSELHIQYHQRSILRQQFIRSITEPVLILVMGSITGIIVIGMYLPVFQMSMIEQ